MRKLLILLALSSLVYLSVFSQVKIREEVEVEAKTLKNNFSSITSYDYNHTLTFSIELPDEYSDYAVMKLAGYGSTEGDGFGFSSVTVNSVRPGSYTSGVYFFHVRVLGSSTNSIPYTIMLDDEIVESGTGQLRSDGAQPYFNIEYSLPLSSDFLLDVYVDNNCNDRKAIIEIDKFSDITSPIMWNPSKDKINLSFSKGGEFMSFAEFVDATVGSILGKDIDVFYEEIGSIVVVPDNGEVDPLDHQVIIKAQVLGIEHQVSVNLPDPPTKEFVYFIDGPLKLQYYYGTMVNYKLILNGLPPSCSNYYEPSDSSVNIEIIRGDEFINLYDFSSPTYEPKKILTGLFSEGQVLVGADAKPILTKDTAIVRLSSTDDNVDPVDIRFILLPQELLVEASPAKIFTDDSTQLSFKQLNTEGNYVQFPHEQLFQVFNDTPGFGILYSEPFDEYSNQLSGVPEGIKFYSYPEIPVDTVFAEIFVSTEVEDEDEGGGGGGSSITLNGNTQDKTSVLDETFTEVEKKTGDLITKKRLTTGINNKQNKIKIPTYNNAIVSPKLIKLLEKNNETGKHKETKNNQITLGMRTLFGTIAVPIIKKADCSDYQCESQFTPYTGDIKVEIVSQDFSGINYFNHDGVASGIFKPLFDNFDKGLEPIISDQLIVDYNLDVCYEGENDSWRFSVINDAIFFRAIKDVSEENILRRNADEIIHDLDELSIIPDDEICLALENFENQRTYGKGGKYWLLAKTWAHEDIHQAKFEELIENILNKKIEYFGSYYKYKELLSFIFQPACNDLFQSEISAKQEFKKYLVDIIDSFTKLLKEEYESRKSVENELKCHNDFGVQNVITMYKKTLQNGRSRELWENCLYKEVFN